MNDLKLLIVSFYFLIAGLSIMYGQDNTPGENSNSNGKHWLEMIQDPDVNFYEAQDVFYKYWENRDDYKGNGWKVFKRWEYINELRVLPDGKLQAPGYVFEEYNKYMKDVGKSPSGNWTIQGPTSYVINNTGQPTGMGRINAIAFHPTDVNTIYAGSPSGGFWKTTNGGTTWSNLSSNLATLGVSSILVHPTNPDIIYIGSGDRDANDALPLGVFKTTDGGETWTQINNSMGNVIVGAMLMHPSDPNTIIAATSSGIFKTTDGGSTWSQKATGNFKDLHFKPGDPTTVFAVKIVTPSEFHRSTNSGDTWTQVTSGIPSSGIGSRMVIGVSPANGNYVYLLQIKSSDATIANILRSTDGGQNFSTSATGPNMLDYSCDGSGTASQATYDLCMTVDPNNVNNVFVGGVNNWKSNDAGVTWTISSHWIGSSYGEPCASSVHADQHCYAWSPLNGRLYVGHDGGIHYTANGGTTWNEITSNLAITQVYRIGQGASNVNYTLFGCQDNGSSASTNGSTFYTTRGGDGMETLIDYSNPNYCYNTYHSGDIRRTSGGPTGSYNYSLAANGVNGIDESGAWVTPYFLHKADHLTMFIGLKNIWRSNNVTSSPPTWTKISTGESLNCAVLEQSPVDLDIIYAVRSGSLKRTDNANDAAGSVTWIVCTLPGNNTPTDVKAHPTDANIVFATAGYNIYKSTDKGITWTDISSNLPELYINCLVIDKNANEGIYIGNQTSIWYKDATMTNWALFSNGLPPVDIRELEIYYDNGNPSNNRIKAGTYGRGVWQSDLANISVIDPTGFTAFVSSSTQIDLSWIKNANNNNVLVAWSSTGTFGQPLDGTAYSQGNTLVGGGAVLYSGSASNYSHSGLSASALYYYRIWSVNGTNQYSAGVLPISTTTDCDQITALSYSCNFDNSQCWKIVDYTGQRSWQIGSTTNPTNPPTILTSPYAYISSSTGYQVNYNSDLISPPFDLSSYNYVSLSFKQHYDGDNSWSSIASVYYSVNNGLTWTLLASYTTDQNNTTAIYSVPGVAGQSNVKFKWNYFDDAVGSYMWGIDDVQVVDALNSWTGTIDSDWFKAGNWGKGSIPSSANVVTIPSSAPNQPQINANTAVCADLIIQSGASLTMNNSSSYTLSVTGDWTNNGTFNRGIGTVEFIGSNSLQTIKGSSTTAYYILKVNKGAQDKILEATSFITLNAAANPLVLASGTFKLSSASSIIPFTSSVTIGAGTGLWNNGGIINSGNISWTLNSGMLKISAGTVNVGTSSGNGITYMNSGSFIIEGGSLNVAGRISPNSGTSIGSYTQSGGTVTVNAVGSTSTTRAPFEINSGVPFTISGGTIIVSRASSHPTADVIISSTTNNVTGGTLQIGNALTPAGQTIRIYNSVPVYNLVVNNHNSPTAYISTTMFAVYNDISILGGTLDAEYVSLNVKGDFTNSGTFMYAEGTVTFNGFEEQIIGGSNATIFNNLNIDGTNVLLGSTSASRLTTVGSDLTINTGKMLTIGSNQSLTVSGTLTNNAGKEGLIIKSDATGTGSFINATTGVDAKVERFLTKMKWHFIGMPVESGVAGVFHLPSGHSDIYLKTHIESTNSWGPFIVPVNTPLIQGRGYECWVGNAGFNQDETIIFPGKLGAGNYTTSTGGFYQLEYTTGHGLNLICNPYPSALQANISGWSKINVSNKAWTWAPDFGNYVFWGSGDDYGSGSFGTMTGGIIPEMQAFFVEATGSSPSLTIPQSSRVHSSQAYYKDSEIPANTFRIDVSGNGYKDALFISLNPASSTGYDLNLDVEKLFGLDEAPQLYSLGSDKKLSINTLPEINENVIIFLGFECAANKTFELEVSGMEGFEQNIELYLEDLKLDIIHNLKEVPLYNFAHVAGNNPERFRLHFSKPNSTEESSEQLFTIFAEGTTIYLRNSGGRQGVVSIYDLTGRLLQSNLINCQDGISVEVNVQTGLYLVKFENRDMELIKKVFIKN